MTTTDFIKTSRSITYALNRKELKTAFDDLRTCINQTKQHCFLEKLDKLEETYINLLRYRTLGVNDPMQESIYQNMLISTYALNDALCSVVLTKESSTVYYTKRRMLEQGTHADYPSLHAMLTTSHEVYNQTQFDAATASLFTKVWATDPLTDTEQTALEAIVSDAALPYTVNCMLVSALMLSLQHRFDSKRLLLLFKTAHQKNLEIRIRAIVSLLIVLSVYNKRTSLYPFIADLLDELALDTDFSVTVRQIILKFIGSYDTEKITKKLQEDILPTMMKFSPKLNNKLNLGEFSNENGQDEFNPEWQQELEDSGVSDKLKQFSEMQLEGADVMHSSFVHLKSYPFFTEVNNWFLPFSPTHSSVENNSMFTGTDKELIATITKSSFICNSDKYSIFFSLIALPPEYRKMVAGEINNEASESKRAKYEASGNRGASEIILSQYIQDLYRFFKIYPRHLDFNDPFAALFNVQAVPLFKKYISDTESLSILAEYYLAKEHYNEAFPLFNELAASNPLDASLFQKIGFCHEMAHAQPLALAAYLHADLLNPRSKWNIRKIAKTYKALNQPSEALVYYKRLNEFSPNSIPSILNIGQCYLSLKNSAEALNYFFKADFIDSQNMKVWRAIAWCSFLTNKFEQAERYYAKIVSKKANIHDYINAGHTAWVLKKLTESIQYYTAAIALEGNDFYAFQAAFEEDIPDLIQAGVMEDEIPLLLDQLRYSINK